MEKQKSRKEDETKRQEKKLRRAMRAFKSHLKKIEPPVISSSTWDEVCFIKKTLSFVDSSASREIGRVLGSGWGRKSNQGF